MPSDTGDTRRSAARPHGGSPAGSEQDQPQQAQLPCPRCDSINTKFCYYNNYNFSQPRHFCKSCRRYWTHGGTLRDIPVGGGSRKSAKRSRTNAGAVATDANSIGPLQATPVLFPGGGHCGSVQLGSALSLCGSFTSLLNGNITTSGHASATNGTGGFIGLGGFGLGLGPALEDVGFGIGRSVWPFSGFTDGGAGAGVGGNSSSTAQLNNTWQLESIENSSGYVAAGDCFAWPDLAISTPGNTLK